MDFDVVVIGGGVVGLSIAYFSSKKFNVLLIERHPSYGWEASSRNSEVIHSGIYYPPNSLKAKLCVEGNKSLYDWCEKNRIPYKKTGKIIVASESEEIYYLEKLFKNAYANGVEQVELLDKQDIKKLEKNVLALAGLWVKSTGIFDSHKFMDSLYCLANANGCCFAFRHSVVGIEKAGERYKLSVVSENGENFSVETKFVVNSAGLESDTVSSFVGLDVDKLNYRLVWAKGHYFRIKPSKSGLVSRLIYPVPPKNSSFLGIHLTIELDGGLKLGPDLVYLDKRDQDYSVPEILKEKFLSAVSKYITGIELDDLMPDQAGIRPKLKTFEKYPDFIIKEERENGYPGFVNLVGIESPGLTCCLPIGNLVYNLLRDIR